MRRSLLIGVALAVLVGIIASVGVSGYAALTPINSTTPVPRQTPDGEAEAELRNPSLPVVGVSAIVPPVTAQKLEAYVSGHPSEGGIQGTNVRVEGVQFTTVGEFRSQLREADPFWNNFVQTDAIAVVTLTGEFTSWDPEGAPHTYTSAYRVFSVVSGNQLAGGVTP